MKRCVLVQADVFAVQRPDMAGEIDKVAL